jgi:hypothetical protein
MVSGRGSSDEERWDAELWYGPDEELEHELALAAALDRSRFDLSPDPDTADRMRGDFFARLEQEWGTPEHETERTAVIPPIPAVALGATDVIPAAQDEPVREDDEPAGAEVVSMVGRKGRKRHTMPANHPENPRRPKTGRRVALVGAAAAAGLVALVGGTAAMSQGALPGDSLYSMKLMSESTGSALTFGDAAQAQRQLDIAATRLAEIESLQRAGRSPDAATYAAALKAFDVAASEGSRMVLAGPDPTERGLGDLGAWAQRQSDTLAALETADEQVPGAARDSARLMERVAQRTAALQARIGCTEVSDGADDLGPLPAAGACVPAPSAGSSNPAVQAGPSGSSQRGPASATPESATTETTGPAGPTDTTTPQQEGGLLDPLLGGEESADSTTSGSPTSTTSSGSSSDDQNKGGSGGGGGLLPPISLPPLLPGLPSITLG